MTKATNTNATNTVWAVAADAGYNQTPKVVGIFATKAEAEAAIAANAADPDAPYWRTFEVGVGEWLGFRWETRTKGFADCAA